MKTIAALIVAVATACTAHYAGSPYAEDHSKSEGLSLDTLLGVVLGDSNANDAALMVSASQPPGISGTLASQSGASNKPGSAQALGGPNTHSRLLLNALVGALLENSDALGSSLGLTLPFGISAKAATSRDAVNDLGSGVATQKRDGLLRRQFPCYSPWGGFFCF